LRLQTASSDKGQRLKSDTNAGDERRVRFTVGVGYPASIEEARETIHRALQETEGVLADPEPWVYVTELAPSALQFA
jgi:small-conductance mechanosensitive channel